MEDNKGMLEKIAFDLREAEKSLIPIEHISKRHPNLTVKDAYDIQLINVDYRVKKGEVITGKKIGLTSKAMQELFNVNQPDYGHLFGNMEIKDGIIPLEKMLIPKVEGEIAFILKEDIKGPNATVDDVIRATDYVTASLEVVDSRFKDWNIKLVDTVADNGSSAFYAIGDKKVDPRKIDLKSIKMEFYRNGEKINEGTGRDVLGDPAYCVAWLANKLWEFGVTLKKGEIILSGAITAAIPVEKGNCYKVVFSDLGGLSLTCK